MLFTTTFTSTFFLLLLINSATSVDDVVSREKDVEIVVGEKFDIVFEIRKRSPAFLDNGTLSISKSLYLDYPYQIGIINSTARLPIVGIHPVSGAIVEIVNCSSGKAEKCPLNLEDAFVRVSVLRSRVLEFFVEVVGWLYFFAWSISFYPQIWLNIQRKSVIGLNFDFLALNLVGFAAYALYNLLMYFNSHVQQIYHFQNPHSPPPVLANDVVFAVHAFFACFVTVIQCFIYERESQRVTNKCIIFIVGLIAFGLLSASATVLNKITILAFVTSLSYIKMAVTCSKYFPQAIYNYMRKSTVGWSIGNVLLDFTGGTLDILQMILQAINVDDWSAFYANPVKFGLGFVSIFFDLIFMFQHYVLYRDVEAANIDYEGVENLDSEIGVPGVVDETDYGTNSSERPIFVPRD